MGYNVNIHVTLTKKNMFREAMCMNNVRFSAFFTTGKENYRSKATNAR